MTRWPLALLLTVALLFTATSCHDDYDDYYTTAVVTIALPEGATLQQMQGTVRLTNLNNRQSYTSSTFSGASVTLEVMRGVYSIDVEGSLRYTTADGASATGNFRAATSYCEFLDHPSAVTLNIIFM